jgi:hypothetical protein
VDQSFAKKWGNFRPAKAQQTGTVAHHEGLRYCVLGGLHRSSPDDLWSSLRLEDRRLLSERIDALPRLCGGLLDDNELGKSWYNERSGFLEFFMANFRHRLDDALHVLSRNE